MKKIITLLLVLITVLSMATFAGCGDDTKKDDSKSDATAKTTATAESKATESAKATESIKATENTKPTADIQETETPVPTAKPSLKSDAELIIGKWKTDFDYGKLMTAEMNKEDSSVAVKSLKVDMFYEFSADGKATMNLADNAGEKIMNFMKELTVEITKKELEKEAKEYGVSVEELLEGAGASSVEELVEAQFKDADASEYIPSEEGTYSIADGKLVLDNSESKTTYTYQITDDTLKFINIEIDGEVDTASKELLPMTFTRVN